MRLHWQKECNYSVNCNLCLFVPQIVAYLGVNKKKEVIKGGKFKNVIKQTLKLQAKSLWEKSFGSEISEKQVLSTKIFPH